MQEKEWFASWFDSPYYPILYRHRDFAEAEQFIAKLVAHLAPAPNAHFLDLACGRGRHSRFLNQMGYQVTGLDLSPESISDAKTWESDSLHFAVHDMRDPLPGKYDVVLNLFTSFGYFSDFADNIRVLENIATSLLPGGTFVMDFLNAEKTIRQLVLNETKELDGIHFDIRRESKDGFIYKYIDILDGAKAYSFQERVQALRHAQICEIAKQKGMQLVETWGDYHGGVWDEQNSPRMILFFRT